MICSYLTEVAEQELSLAESHSANVHFGNQRLELRQELQRGEVPLGEVLILVFYTVLLLQR